MPVHIWSEVTDDVNAAVPPGVTHIGVVLNDTSGSVMIRQPATPSYGVTATIPRVRIQPGELPTAALERWFAERTGDSVRASAYPIPQVYVTDNSATMYFVSMAITEDQPPRVEASESRWLPRKDAEYTLGQSKNAASRNRDLAVLSAAAGINPSPFRRVLLMLQELHSRGFGRLRAATWSHQNGYIEPPGTWQCAIVPAAATDPRNAALKVDEVMDQLRTALGFSGYHSDPFETLGKQKSFRWDDAAFDSPKQLADKFFARFRDLCFMGWGQDNAYQHWYEMMLRETEPFGVFYPIGNDYERVVKAYAATAGFLPPPSLP